jgi:hypothetical protein
MKNIGFVAALALLAISACSQMSDTDRAMLKETNTLAVQAKEAADRAEANSKANAASSAKAADKADRIFRAGQNK